MWPPWRPKPRTCPTVMPDTPASFSATLTSSSLKGFTTAVTNFFSVSLDVVAVRVAGGHDGLAEGRLGEGFFLVDRDVADRQHLFRFTQTAEHKLHDIEHHRRAHRGEANDPRRRQELLPELVEGVGVEPPADREVPRSLVVRALDPELGHARVGEEADQEPADEAGDAVGVDHTHRVVDLGEG